MATYAEKRLVGESIVIDGCSWVFTGAAARTIQMLGALRNGGMDEVVREIVASLDSGNPRGKVMH